MSRAGSFNSDNEPPDYVGLTLLCAGIGMLTYGIIRFAILYNEIGFTW